MRLRALIASGALTFCLSTTPAAAATTALDIEAVRASKHALAVRIDTPIHLDGLLDEPAWAAATPTGDFYQQQPAEFELATHRTEVRFLYDDSTLYVGAMLYDDAPGRLITNDLKRDFGARDTDSFGLILDTFKDRRNAYGFLVNPGGAVRDTLAYENGRKNDPNWHGVWLARTAVLKDGWSVEYAIPFKTLRFPEGLAQEWGLNMLRVARRSNEVATWSPVPRQFTHYNVTYAGVLSGMDGVRSGNNLYVKPFVAGGATRGVPGRPGWDRDLDGGVDLKWGVTSSLLLDGTYRTDFSQVEADEQQINLTRFSLFFPEKREFFLENPAAFQIGLSDAENDETRRDIVPFFSRRIGLSASGQPIPVVGGSRLTGRAGGTGIGVLSMRTEEYDGRPADTFTAMHVTRPVGRSATLGGFYFGRNPSGGSSGNQVGGFDFWMRPARTVEMEAFAMRSATDGLASGWAGRTGVRVDGSAHRGRIGFFHVDDAFRHDLGYVRRRGVGTLYGNYARVLRPSRSGGRIREHSIGGSGEITGDERYRHVLTRLGSLTYKIVFNDGAELRVSGGNTFERIDTAFGIGSGLMIQPGTYGYSDGGVEYSSNKSAIVSGGVEARGGEFWNGHQKTLNGNVRVRFNAHVASAVTFGRNAVDLPQGEFVGTLAGFRLDWSFTPRMFLNAFVQYNGETDTWLSNVRYNLVHRPLSDIYVVWNETRLPGLTRRAILFKYTHLVAF